VCAPKPVREWLADPLEEIVFHKILDMMLLEKLPGQNFLCSLAERGYGFYMQMVYRRIQSRNR
jgi:hypothetical protein